MAFLYHLAPLPGVDDVPEIPTHYEVCTLKGELIADFGSYDDALDLICLVEEFCESRGLVRNEKLLYELYDLNLVCAECPSNHDVDVCNSCSIFRRLAFIRSELDSE